MQSHVIGILALVAIIVTTSIAGLQNRKNYLYSSDQLREGRRYGKRHLNSPSIYSEKSYRRTDSSTCITVLMQQHSQICDVLHVIRKIQDVVPQLHGVVKNRMGTRRFDFKYMANKGKTAMEQLYEVVSRLGDGIKKFVNFLGTAEETFGTDLQSTKTQRSHVNPSIGTSENVFIIDDNESLDADLAIPDIPPSRRASTVCESDIESLGSDACTILKQINELEEVMKKINDPTLEKEDPAASQLAISIRSSEIVLAGFFESLYRSIIGHNRVKKVVDTPARRYLVNENHENIAEIFETPNFRVEFVNENPNHSNRRSWEWINETQMDPTYTLSNSNFRFNLGRIIGRLIGKIGKHQTLEAVTDMVKAAKDFASTSSMYGFRQDLEPDNRFYLGNAISELVRKNGKQRAMEILTRIILTVPDVHPIYLLRPGRDEVNEEPQYQFDESLEGFYNPYETQPESGEIPL